MATVYRELTLFGLMGLPVPEAAMAAWYRMCDELTDGDLETEMEAERELASGIRRKRPDGWAVHWGRRMIRIMEFTWCNDYRSDWQETTETYKTARHQGLRDEIKAAIPPECKWSVEIVCFTLGIRGSYAESRWAASESLAALGVTASWVTRLMMELVPTCLDELNAIYLTRTAALRQRANAN
jgi:hypothetical protein